MTAKDWISIASALAWPIVALIALIYVWQSDAVAKLLQISEAVKDLKATLAELVETEKSLSERTSSVSETTAVLREAIGTFAEIKANVENIRDRVEEEAEQPTQPSGSREPSAGTRVRLDEMEKAWADLLSDMSKAFGTFDKRSVAGEAYRFAHGNRKGAKLSYETADEIARLHSSMKSYRRRQKSSELWLDEDTYNKFISACRRVAHDVSTIVANEHL